MNRTAVKVILAAVALVLVGGIAWLVATRGTRGGLGGVIEQLTGAPAGTEKVMVLLYFAGPGGYLVPERRELNVTADPKDRIRKIVGAVLDGPRQRDLGRSFPKGVELGSVLLAANGTVYVDLRSETMTEPPSAGSLEEMQRVFSVVDSITGNVEQAQRVALLWNGIQRESFGGHLDASRPFVADRSLIAQ
ncbi:MAG TPA: GerMN domain-containing protein [Thermoanaerobaculia bacterium]|nr:GerMN domain-containing protein [Thermoanaerobaculia bacterium]